MNNKKFFFISAAVFLAAFGDLRNLIGAQTYWALWAGVALGSVFATSLNGITKSPLPKEFFIGISIIVVAALLEATYNSNFLSVYQALKLIAIFLFAWAISIVCRELKARDIYKISSLVINVQLAIFLISLYLLDEWHFMLGDGRQGSIVAYPGVSWKTGVYLLPFVLAYLIDNRKSITGYLTFLSATYLIFVDGSRTAIILWGLILICFVALVIIRSSKISLIIFASCALVSVLAFFIFELASSFLENALQDFVISTKRFDEEDSLRVKMYSEGIKLINQCLPFGCGFGESAVETDQGMVVIHNAYIQIAGDFGFIGVIGFLMVIFSPGLKLIYKYKSWISLTNVKSVRFLFPIIASFSIAVAYFFHPYSTEMSDWGWLILINTWLIVISTTMQLKK